MNGAKAVLKLRGTRIPRGTGLELNFDYPEMVGLQVTLRDPPLSNERRD